MKNIALAALIAATLTLTGCVTLPPPAPVPATQTEPVTQEPEVQPVTEPAPPAEPATPPAVFVPNETAFMDAITPGLTIPELAPALAETMIETGYTVCLSLNSGATREQIIALAVEHLSDPESFQPGFPTLFVDSAITHLCGP